MTVRVAGPDDWAAWRDLRLEALLDTPIGFVETYQNASAKDEQAWRQRMADVPLSVLAGSAGRVVGMSSGFLIDGRPFLGAVYVTPAHRGTGVLAALTAPVVAWARALKATELLLEVHERNLRARTAYARLGFVETGVTTPYPLDPGGLELVMALPLAST